MAPLCKIKYFFTKFEKKEMITFGKIDSTEITVLGKRLIKFLVYGAKTASECLPFGVDSNPLKGMTAIHATTSNESDSVIIGYIDKDKLAAIGETRFFAKDESGNVVTFLWLKNDGTIELNGNEYTSVRFEPLKEGLNNQNELINTELLKIQTAILGLGGTYTPSNIVTEIDNSQSPTVKLE